MVARTTLFAFLVALFLLSLTAPFTDAADAKSPHPHSGKVPPFKPGDPKVKLNKKALKLLKNGKPYQTQVKTGNRGRGLVVQDIAAPPSVVWDTILNFDNYAKMVPRTTYSKNYGVSGSNPRTIKTGMKIGVVVTKMEFFIKHLYYPRKSSLVWTLDYSRKSDIDDSVGFWYVAKEGSGSRVYYSVEVSMFDWVPNIVMDILSKKALTEATGWVKKEAEKVAKASPAPGDGKKGSTSSAPEADGASEQDDDRTLARRWAMVACILGLLVVNLWLLFESFEHDAQAGRKKRD
mmetsp:Transcript_20409/g.42567  ORF Transcript_20409/g.42567 Transcript_20409/m.42567 type:complete len:291 (-) Transcript_20409:46-918(-)|eukprot:CAMPEP_0197548352 /NCGR_PEP_ID=MMETSP1320-20131121/2501_1 /TAXON_ID=91990 /ORGANISM="Bolidomonas sp., Strain RCC2347" /LENGTH=290 /DNA_ID=CAMNT_0043108349 /DNA_START=88 /DNA_END=960 /DNA_ORIENTATION=-